MKVKKKKKNINKMGGSDQNPQEKITKPVRRKENSIPKKVMLNKG